MCRLGQAAGRIVLLWVVLTCGVRADIYKWQDENGVTHYGETAPQQIPAAREISTRLPPLLTLESAPEPQPPPAGTAKKSLQKPSSQRASQPASKSRLTAQQRRARDHARAEAKQQKKCTRYQQKIARISQQLNAGYREPKGNELRRQRRELESIMFRECR